MIILKRPLAAESCFKPESAPLTLFARQEMIHCRTLVSTYQSFILPHSKNMTYMEKPLIFTEKKMLDMFQKRLYSSKPLNDVHTTQSIGI